jgi:MFS family permease
MIIVFTVGMRRVFYPIYVNQLGFAASVIGLMLSIRALITVFARLFIIPITRLLGGRLATLIICMVGLAVGLGMTPFCRNLPALILNSVFIGIGIGLVMPMSQATVFESVDSSERGVALGVRLTGNRLAQLSNPLLFGLLTQCFGISVAFWSAGGILFLVTLPALFMVAGKRHA